ncbi:MAG: YraN family protein [Lachnospiraceae bacterium]|nr:YraN family protein [Lachnospiraceae bacterium]
MNKRKVGAEHEELAVSYIKDNHIRILERNFRSRSGEIDIIGYDGEYYIFFEVKYRKSDASGNPAEAVNYKKQRVISRVADYYRICAKLSDTSNIRFDVISILGAEIEWYKNAFYYIPPN